MRTILSLAIASALIASPIAAQSSDRRMETPCPMHLTDLSLTPVQDSAFIAIRAAHRAEVRAVHARLGLAMPKSHEMPAMHTGQPVKTPQSMPHAAGAAKHDSATHAAHKPAHEAMQASMARSLEAARAVLTDTQRARFDAAAKAHKAEKEKLAASGIEHSCSDCCPDHDAHHKS
jgi:hypothetical protein